MIVTVATPSDDSDAGNDSDDNPIVALRRRAGAREKAGARGRRFTLNPLIFAKQQKELRRQSVSALRLSYYPADMDGRHCIIQLF
jgi:hypothetical protein